jgi:GNAT superfamily N-acetyltransferase
MMQSLISSRKMTAEIVADAFTLLSEFLRQDEHYLDSSQAYGDRGDVALRAALELFLQKPDLGFVWIAYDQATPVAICVVSFAISTSIGGVVAKLDDVFVSRDKQARSIGSIHLDQLKGELRRMNVLRIDTSVHIANQIARSFYLKHGFESLHEERLTCRL